MGIIAQVHGVLPSGEPSLYCLVNIAISWTKKLLQPIENCNIENYKYLNNEKRQKDEIIHGILS